LDPGMSITHTMGFTIQTIFKLDCFYWYMPWYAQRDPLQALYFDKVNWAKNQDLIIFNRAI
jgi:hypothetical protein